MQDFIAGINYFLAGFKLIFKPKIRRYMIIPFLINLGLFVAMFFLLRYAVGELNTWLAQYLPSWLHWLSIIIWFLFIVCFLLFFIYAFVTLANLVAAPFNSFLAEQVEWYLTGTSPQGLSLWQTLQDIPRILGRQFAILGFYLPRALLIIIIFFVPIIHFLAGIIWFLFNAWYMTLTYVDYPSDNHRIALSEVREWLSQHRALTLGFGMSVLVMAMLPVINFFTLPAAVAGATKLWLVEKKTIINKGK